MLEQRMRRTGIEVIGNSPWGTHFCQFYQSKQDLLEILVPYFRQGLADNEFCMWVTSEPLEVEEARAALFAVEPDLGERIRQGQIEILDYTEWYTPSGSFQAEQVLQGWVDKLAGALARGFEGLRLTGNTFWLESKDWAGFTAYEEAVNRVIGNYRMLAVCTYSLGRCGAHEIMDVLGNHRFALVKRDGRWQMVESSERRLAEAALAESEQKYSAIFDKSPFAMALTRMPEGILVSVNDAFLSLFECRREEVIGQASVDLGMLDPGSLPHVAAELEERGVVRDLECSRSLKSGGRRFLSLNLDWLGIGGVKHALMTIRDVTEGKQAEQALRQLSQFPLQNPNPVLRVASDGTLLFANEPARQWLAPLGWQASGPLPVQLLAVVAQALGGAHPIEMEIANPEGRAYYLTAARPPDEDYVNLYVIDISQRKRTELALQRSEAMLRSVLDQMPSGVTVHDAGGGELILSNPRSKEIMGSLISSPGAQFRGNHPDGRRYRTEDWPLSRSMTSGEVVQDEEIDCERSDGARMTLSMSSAPIRDPDGRIIAGVRIFHDITERRRFERQLKEVAEKYSSLFNTTSDGIWIHNLKGEILEVNEACCRMSGYSPDELRHMPISKLEVVESPAETAEHIKRLIEGGGHDHFETRHRRKDGSVFDVDIIALYFDKVLGRIAIFARDITGRKQAEQALKESYEELDRFNRAMVGREARMIELKRQVNDLFQQAGQAAPYPLDFEK